MFVFYHKFFNFLEKKTWLPYCIEFFLGMKPRGMKESASAPSRVTPRNQEWYDAEIARKLQEEEILVSKF